MNVIRGLLGKGVLIGIGGWFDYKIFRIEIYRSDYGEVGDMEGLK